MFHLIDSQRWDAILPGLYRSPAHPRNRAQHLTAVCLYNPRASIGFTTAGQEHGLRKMLDRWIHVLAPHGCGLAVPKGAVPGVVVHRCRRFDRADLGRRRPDGVRLTRVPRTLFDASAHLSTESIESAIEGDLDGSIDDMARVLSTRGWRPQSAA